MTGEEKFLEISHSNGGKTTVYPDGRILIFDKEMGLYGIASGARFITPEMDKESALKLITYLSEVQQLQIMQFLGRLDESVGTGSQTTG